MQVPHAACLLGGDTYVLVRHGRVLAHACGRHIFVEGCNCNGIHVGKADY